MLRWLFRRTVGAFERRWNYDVSYLREIIDASPRAAWRFATATKLGSYRRDVPIEALVAAGITPSDRKTAVRARSWPRRWRSDKACVPRSWLVSAFVTAATSGDLQTLMTLLAEDVRVTTDGGGKVPSALNVIKGADRAARFIVGTVSKGLPEGSIIRLAAINGLPGLILSTPDGSVQTVAFEIERDLVRAIYAVNNPEKLSHVVESAGASAS